MGKFLWSIAHKQPVVLVISLAILVVLLVAAQPGAAQAASQSPASAVKSTCERWYTVRSNDTLGTIASRFGIEPYQVVNSNDLRSPYTIYMGQKLCIPKAAIHADQLKKLPKKYLNQGAASFNASWSPAGIVIKPLNFPVKSSLLVKVDDLGDPAAQWVKLGVFTTRKGVKQYSFRLPRDLQDAHQLTVCVKNLNTDLRMCRNTPYR